MQVRAINFNNYVINFRAKKPISLAEKLYRQGEPVFVLALKGHADKKLFPK